MKAPMNIQHPTSNAQHPMSDALVHIGRMSAVRAPLAEANVSPLPRQRGGGKLKDQNTKLKGRPKHQIPITRAGLSDWTLGFGHSHWPLNFELPFASLRDAAQDVLKNGAGTASS